MTTLPLPALDGRSPLGFLAAVGVLRLTAINGYPDARLSWSLRDCTAELHGAHAEIADLAAFLGDIVGSIPEGGVLPDLPADFPPLGAAPDQLRLPRPQLRAYAEELRRQNASESSAEAERWLCSLVTDLRLDEKGRAAISMYTAPSGKQSMRTMLEKPLAALRESPKALSEALAGWRRYPGVTGEYLDHRVLFDAADAADGKSLERGVPGATWLALMAYPLLLTTGQRAEVLSSGWQLRDRFRRGGRRLVYPLWSRPVAIQTVRALLEHPAVTAADPGPATGSLGALSVFRICAADRQRLAGRTFAGVLTPVPVIARPSTKPGQARRAKATRTPSGRGRSDATGNIL